MTNQLIGEVTIQTNETLREILAHAYDTFTTYRCLFALIGVTKTDIVESDPVRILQTIPLLENDTFNQLVEESIFANDHIVDLELSSGTTGRRKRRVISLDDDISERDCLVNMFHVCGISASDKVACVDTGPLTIMTSFTKALDQLGVVEAYSLSIDPDLDNTLEHLFTLSPSVLIGVSSIIERLVEKMGYYHNNPPFNSLQRIIYVGEPLSSSTRYFLENTLGIEVFGYYGTSETSALGIECQNHSGIHLFTDRNLIERTQNVETPDSIGEIIVTTMSQLAMPLLRYPVKDLVETVPGTCPCGLKYPRVNILSRVDETISILGSKFSYNRILNAAYNDMDEPHLLEIVLTKNSTEQITLILPNNICHRKGHILNSLLNTETELGYLSAAKLVDIRLKFVAKSHFDSNRKSRRIADRR